MATSKQNNDNNIIKKNYHTKTSSANDDNTSSTTHRQSHSHCIDSLWPPKTAATCLHHILHHRNPLCKPHLPLLQTTSHATTLELQSLSPPQCEATQSPSPPSAKHHNPLSTQDHPLQHHWWKLQWWELEEDWKRMRSIYSLDQVTNFLRCG